MGLAAGAHCGGGLFLEGWSVPQLFVPDPEKDCVEFAVLGPTRKPKRYKSVARPRLRHAQTSTRTRIMRT